MVVPNQVSPICYYWVLGKWWRIAANIYAIILPIIPSRNLRLTLIVELPRLHNSKFASLSSEEPLWATRQTGLVEPLWYRYDTCYRSKKSTAHRAPLSLHPKTKTHHLTTWSLRQQNPKARGLNRLIRGSHLRISQKLQVYWTLRGAPGPPGTRSFPDGLLLYQKLGIIVMKQNKYWQVCVMNFSTAQYFKQKYWISDKVLI